MKARAALIALAIACACFMCMPALAFASGLDADSGASHETKEALDSSNGAASDADIPDSDSASDKEAGSAEAQRSVRADEYSEPPVASDEPPSASVGEPTGGVGDPSCEAGDSVAVGEGRAPESASSAIDGGDAAGCLDGTGEDVSVAEARLPEIAAAPDEETPDAPSTPEMRDNGSIDVFIGNGSLDAKEDIEQLLANVALLKSLDAVVLDSDIATSENVLDDEEETGIAVTDLVRNTVGDENLAVFQTDDLLESGSLEGSVELKGAYLYGIGNGAMKDAAQAEKATSVFSDWIAQLGESGNDSPIIVVSNLPLHQVSGENEGASLWFDAINDAARKFNVIVLWGIGDSCGISEDNSMDFLSRNQFMKPDGGSVACAIQFTYMNVGCVNGSLGTLVSIGKDTVTLSRFGVKGVGDTYTVSPVANESNDLGERRRIGILTSLDKPIDPDNPDEPLDPSNPDDLVDPSNPDNPTDPSAPGNPDDPGNPSNPDKPNKPGKSHNPEKSDNTHAEDSGNQYIAPAGLFDGGDGTDSGSTNDKPKSHRKPNKLFDPAADADEKPVENKVDEMLGRTSAIENGSAPMEPDRSASGGALVIVLLSGIATLLFCKKLHRAS